MKVLLFCSFYYLMLVSYCTMGQDEENAIEKEDENNQNIPKRYVIETDFKPPIFGSYKFDPVKQMFIIDDDSMNATLSLTTEAASKTSLSSSSSGLLFLRNGTVGERKLALRSIPNIANLNKYTAMSWRAKVKKFN